MDSYIGKSSVDCDFCRCVKQALRKETRGTTPDGDSSFKTNVNEKEDVHTIDTGFNSRKPRPEERIEISETEVEELKTHGWLSESWSPFRSPKY